MPMISMKELYQDARARTYVVAAFDVINYETIAWAIEAAEAECMPVIIMLYPGMASHVHPAAVKAITEAMAAQTKVPVALHLDHSPSWEVAVKFMPYFPSVMVDGSSLPYEENVALTREVVKVAHTMGIVVEAELGHVGSGSNLDDFQNTDKFTDPQVAAQFIEATGCDSLAIAIGNGHGQYIATPQFDFARLRAIRAAVDVPLVLHGGSGTPDDQFSECVQCGMSKFNLFTEVNKRMGDAVKEQSQEVSGLLPILSRIKPAALEIMRHRIHILNPNGVKAF